MLWKNIINKFKNYLVNKLFLYNAKIWIDNEIRNGHIVINEQSGRITEIFWKKPNLIAQYGEKLNIEGNLIIPSLVDIHCHLRHFEESHKETFETGAKAAAAGGYTHIFDMPNKTPPVVSNQDINKIEEIVGKIDEADIIPYLLLSEKTQIPLLYEYPFLKAYLGLTTGEYLATENEIEKFLVNSNSFLSVHCEDDNLINENKKEFVNELKYHCEIRGPNTELNSIISLIKIKNKIKNKTSIHVAHTTLIESVKILREAGITFEVTPHHLLLNKKDFDRLGVWAKMNPPLRTKTEQEALFAAFLRGEIPIIATDHAPHTREEKSEFFMSGIPGLETALPSLLNRLKPINLTKMNLLVDALAINPRTLMNFQSKGVISVGEIADLTVIDLNLKRTVINEDLFTKCKWSPWKDEELQGWPVLTIHNGKITYNNL